MSAVAMIGTVIRSPSVFRRTSDLQSVNSALVGYAVQKLATDPAGDFILTLTNLVVGSAVQIETVAGVTLLNATVTTATQVFIVQSYVNGSPLNNLRIKVRKGSSAPFYQPFETLITSFVGSASIFVSQISDQ